MATQCIIVSIHQTVGLDKGASFEVERDGCVCNGVDFSATVSWECCLVCYVHFGFKMRGTDLS